jgi:hypothetical protein
MKALDTIRSALLIADRGTMLLLEDMRNAALTAPTPRGGNHPLWVAGHLAFVEAGVRSVIFGEPHPLEKWAPLFAAGTQPKAEASAYPPFDDVVAAYREHRERNLQLLEQLGDAGLDRPTVAPPPGLEQVMRTAGDSLLLLALHQMNHRGQLADARRAAGREPLFTPGRAK